MQNLLGKYYENFLLKTSINFRGGYQGMAFIPAEDSVTENPMLIVGNEVSGSTTVYEFKLTYPN